MGKEGTRAVVMVSGGIDSTVALWWARSEGLEVLPLSIEFAGRPKRELEAVQRVVDAAQAGPLARSGADVGAHRRDGVRLARQDVALFEPTFGREVQVATAVRAHGTRFLALDVALEPGGVDGLDEEFLGLLDGQAGRAFP